MALQPAHHQLQEDGETGQINKNNAGLRGYFLIMVENI
jgi:hypothetical protein